MVTIDLTALDRVLEVDPVSLSARIQAGATGPVLEDGLREHGLTLRHYTLARRISADAVPARHLRGHGGAVRDV